MTICLLKEGDAYQAVNVKMLHDLSNWRLSIPYISLDVVSGDDEGPQRRSRGCWYLCIRDRGGKTCLHSLFSKVRSLGHGILNFEQCSF